MGSGCMPVSTTLTSARSAYALLIPAVNCPLSVRELWPKSGEEEQKIYAKLLIDYGPLWD